MARKLRIEYAGAVYHVMSRGDRRDDIFQDDQDRQRFLETLGEACQKTGWQIHAYCLMWNRPPQSCAGASGGTPATVVGLLREQLSVVSGGARPAPGLDTDEKRCGKGRFDDWPGIGLPRALSPHPPFGHLLPWGEGGEAALP
jgi:hypothetical protein